MESAQITLLNIIPFVFWFLIIIIAALIIRSAKTHLPEYKYYMPNILAKMFFAVAYGLFYIFLYVGGDTTDKISLSKMSFSHQMVRLFFLEQIYRGFTILKGEPYHHE